MDPDSAVPIFIRDGLVKDFGDRFYPGTRHWFGIRGIAFRVRGNFGNRGSKFRIGGRGRHRFAPVRDHAPIFEYRSLSPV